MNTELRWSAERVAEEIGLSSSTVYKMLRHGAIPAKKAGRNWLVRPEDVSEWADRQPDFTPKQAAS